MSDVTYHHFELEQSVVAAYSWNDAHHTVCLLADLGILALPYPEIWVTFTLDHFLDDAGWVPQDIPEKNLTKGIKATYLVSMPTIKDGEFQAQGRDGVFLAARNGEVVFLNRFEKTATALRSGKSANLGDDEAERYGKACGHATMCLIAALATQGLETSTTVNSRIGTEKRVKAKFAGIGGVTYSTNTTVRVSRAITTSAGRGSNGITMIPHIRRGHIHTFLTEKNRVSRIQRWVAPIFVNADSKFVAKARKYKVKA